MLQLIICLMVGGAFFRLSNRYGKMSIVFGILGAALSYLFTVLTLVITLRLLNGHSLMDESTGLFKTKFLAMAISCAVCYGIYEILKYFWKREKRNVFKEDSLDDLI